MMDKPNTDAELADSLASLEYSQGYYDGYNEGMVKATKALYQGAKLARDLLRGMYTFAEALPKEQRDALWPEVQAIIAPSMAEWDTVNAEITEG